VKNSTTYTNRLSRNDKKRYILYQKMDEIIINDPVIPLFYDKIGRLLKKNG
jgi:ABC-type oligopeptide transport system substrate-binding subunit